MGVLVAARAVLPGDRLEDAVGDRGVRRVGPARRVALLAGHRGVAPGQRPGRLRVVEAGGRLPGLLRVAGGAGAAGNCPRCSSLWQDAQSVDVARGSERVLWHCSQDSAACLPASGWPVCAWSKAFCPALPHQTSSYSTPWCSTWQVLQSRYSGRACRPLPAATRSCSGLWQAEALAGGHALLGVVALEAVRAALELRVGAAQRPGRDLGARGGRGQDEAQRRAPSASAAASRPARPSRSRSRAPPRRGRS